MLPDGRWIVYYRLDGKDKREYFGRGAAGEAAAAERDGQLTFARRRPRRHTYGPAFAELAQAYYQKNHFASDYAKKHLLIRLRANILPHFGAMPAVKINDNDLDEYIAHRRTVRWGRKKKKIGVRDSTIARELTDVKAILNWSVKRTPPLIPFNPVRDFKKPDTDDAIILPPSAAEVDRILAAASAHLVRAIVLSYYLGLRPGAVELLSLRWSDNVDLGRLEILVVSARKGGVSRRLVPIHEKLLPALYRWQAADQKLLAKKKLEVDYLIHYHGRGIKSIQKAWEGALKRAGIKRRLRPYDLRHQFVTAALEAGADVKALAEVVGSSPLTLIKHYQHVARAIHHETVAKIPGLTVNFGDDGS